MSKKISAIGLLLSVVSTLLGVYVLYQNASLKAELDVTQQNMQTMVQFVNQKIGAQSQKTGE